MKKNITLFILGVLTFSFCFSQDVLMTIDRDHIVGPTSTGTISPNLNGFGITRSPNISMTSGTNNPGYSSDGWDANDVTTAIANAEYLQWSMTANSGYAIELSNLDISIGRDNNGPVNWQIFYSYDNFTTAGIPLSAEEELLNSGATIFNFSNLNITSDIGGSINFRLYAWNPGNSNSGTLIIYGNQAWSNYGITDPGIQLSGNLIQITNDSESDIATSLSFDEPDNINYSSFNAISGLTTTNAIKIAEFEIRDGGADFTDDDLATTTLIELGFNILNFDNLQTLAIFDGNTNLKEQAVSSSSITFSDLTITANDNSSKTFDVYATFKTSVTDNEQIQLTVSTALADPFGSTFPLPNAGGAFTSITDDNNRIEVSATTLSFIQQPTDVETYAVMSPAPTVSATDINSNLDLDFSDIVGIVDLSSSAIFESSATTTVNAIDGIATFDNLLFTSPGSGFTLTASSSGLISANSNSFDITESSLNGFLIAIQDFDGTSPQWFYNTDTGFFNAGWGTGGYYGTINTSNASPLNNPNFSNQILGANDLVANGINEFASLTLTPVEIINYNDVVLSFDWQTDTNGNDEVRYEIIYDGVSQGIETLPTDITSGTISVDVPDTVSVVSLIVSVHIQGDNYVGFDNFKLTGGSYNGLVFFNNSWIPYAPSDTTETENALIVNGNYSITSNIKLKDLQILQTGTVTVESNGSLEIFEGLDTSNNLLMNSTSSEYSSLIVNGIALGKAKYSRFCNNAASLGSTTGNNDLISAPLTGQTFEDFLSDNIDNIYYNEDTQLYLFGPFDKSTATYVSYNENENTILEPGNGYRAGSVSGNNFLYDGTINTSIISKSVENSGPYYSAWNLIGNPYPSYLNIQEFINTNIDLFESDKIAIYGYDGAASDGWTILNLANTDANTAMTPGQGFQIAVAANGNVEFTPSMRSVGSTDDFISGRLANDLKFAKLQLNNSNGNNYQTELYFNENASLGLDPGYDAGLYGYPPSFSLYTHLVQDNDNSPFAIQTISQMDINSEITVPLGVKANQNQQLTISMNSNLPEGVEIYLEDNLLNTWTLLNSTEYIFTPTSNLNGTGRFYLHISNSTLGFDNNNSIDNFTVYNKDHLITIKGQLTQGTTINIYDIQGRLIYNDKTVKSATSHYINTNNFSSGTYIIKISSSKGHKSKKISF